VCLPVGTGMDNLTAEATVSTTKRSLLVLSHAMERAFDTVAQLDGGAPGLVLGLFQRREYFDIEAPRYAALAAAGHTIVVGFTGSPKGLASGVHAVRARASISRASEGVVE
jgi:hypothetical protein